MAEESLDQLPFERIREAGLRRIRLGLAPRAAQAQQNVNTAGVRTSGVGQLPMLGLMRDSALAEAGLEESISGQQAQQAGAERMARLQATLQDWLMQRQAGYEADAANTASRRGLQGALISKGLGAAGGLLKTALAVKYPWLRPAVGMSAGGSYADNSGVA